MDAEVLDEKEPLAKSKIIWAIWVVPGIILCGLIRCYSQGILFEFPVILTGILWIIGGFFNYYKAVVGVFIVFAICILELIGVGQIYPNQVFLSFGSRFMVGAYGLMLLFLHCLLSAKTLNHFFEPFAKKET